MVSQALKESCLFDKFLWKFKKELLKKSPNNLRINIIRKALARPKPIRPEPGRVVVVCPSLDAGGAERQIVNTLMGLKGRCRERVTLLCDQLEEIEGQKYNFYLPEAKQSGADIRTVCTEWENQYLRDLPVRATWIRKFVNEFLGRDVINLYLEFSRLRPSVVHAWLDWSNVRAGLAAILAGVPKIVLSGRSVSPKNFHFDSYYFCPAYKVLASYASDRVVFLNNSQAGAIDYADWLDIPASRIKVLRNGISFSKEASINPDEQAKFKEQLGMSEGAKIVGGIFRYYPEKDPILWLDVAKQTVKGCDSIHFVLFGDGVMRKEVEEYIKQNQLSEHVHLYGMTSNSMRDLSICDAMLLTSRIEGTPNVLLEAQCLGIPVVTTRVGGAAEAVSNGETGFVIDSRDANEIAQAVERCVSDKDFRKIANKRGPEFIERQFGMSRMINETISVYDIGLS